MPIATKQFHKSKVLLAPGPRLFAGWKTTAEQKHFAIKEREIDYRIYAHFHPYVGAFSKRLIQASVRGLQAIDTEYQRNADGTFVPLLHSTRVTLEDGVPVALPDGARVKLTDGSVTALPGSILGTTPNGLRLKRPNGTSA